MAPLRFANLSVTIPVQPNRAVNGPAWMVPAMTAQAYKRATLALALLAGVTACGTPSPTPGPGGLLWTVHVDQTGYTVDQPTTWTTSRDTKIGMVTLRG